MEKEKCSVGGWVRVVGRTRPHYVRIGSIGVVRGRTISGNYAVEFGPGSFTKGAAGHDCNGLANECGQWISGPDLEPACEDSSVTSPAQSEKPTNPKDAIGSDKLPLHLWPGTATALGCLAKLDGMLKYGRSNYRAVGVRASIYIDAMERHINAYREGEDLDPDSNLPHLAHILACAAILVEGQAQGNLTDDRNYGGKKALEFTRALAPHVKRLKNKYKDKNPKHYTIKDQISEGMKRSHAERKKKALTTANSKGVLAAIDQQIAEPQELRRLLMKRGLV